MKTAVVSAVLVVCCSVIPLAAAAQSASTCRPQDYANTKDSGYKIKTVLAGTLRQKVQIGPCISDEVARQILAALQAGRIRNLMPQRADGRQPELNKIKVSELSVIRVGQIDEVPPPNENRITAFQYTVEFTDAGSVKGILSGSGHTMYVNLRDGVIEVLGRSIWMS